MRTYVIDHPSMDDKRIKNINKIKYSCGRHDLIKMSKKFGDCKYIYTGLKNQDHENDIENIFEDNQTEIIPAGDNFMRDFSGYMVALNDSLDSSSSDIIICNSSCSALAYESIANADINGISSVLIGAGAKSFYRIGNFDIKFSPHIQTYGLRLIGADVIASALLYIEKCYEFFKEYININEVDYKNLLILKCEIGLNNHLKNNGFDRFLVAPNASLVKVPETFSLAFPFFDSRYKDPRFPLNI